MKIKQIDRSESHLVTALFNQYRVFYKQPSDLHLAREFIQARLDNNESIIFVALAQEEEGVVPVGFTQLYPNYSSVRAIKNWTLNDLYVEPAYRNQKIGETLIKAAMTFSRAQGATFVELSTAVDNFTAQALYEKIGFEKQAHDNGFLTYRIGLSKHLNA